MQAEDESKIGQDLTKPKTVNLYIPFLSLCVGVSFGGIDLPIDVFAEC